MDVVWDGEHHRYKSRTYTPKTHEIKAKLSRFRGERAQNQVQLELQRIWVPSATCLRVNYNLEASTKLSTKPCA